MKYANGDPADCGDLVIGTVDGQPVTGIVTSVNEQLASNLRVRTAAGLEVYGNAADFDKNEVAP